MAVKECIDEIRAHVIKMSPIDCCVKQPMRTSDNKTTMVCDTNCQWLELDRLIANIYVEDEIKQCLTNALSYDAPKD